jgi:hypothetical protein
MKEMSVREYGRWTSYTYIKYRTKKPLAIALSGAGRGLSGKGSTGRHCGGDLTSVQCKPIWNCHNESPVQQIYTNKIFFKLCIARHGGPHLYIVPALGRQRQEDCELKGILAIY